jgi:transcription antitermination factor NusG
VHAESAWYALYTHARREKKVVEVLEERGVECLCPAVRRVRQWHDRQKVIEWPLFPSYVFARMWGPTDPLVLTVPGIADIVKFGDRPAAIRDEEIENIARFVRALGEVEEEPLRVLYRDGEHVRIGEGPYQGVEGIAAGSGDHSRVVVGIEAIGVGFEVEVSAKSVTPNH